ncbi:MAG: cysteine dioxygenase family protein [Dokdonella sp.]|nr:cysteine dioxygenase family protein [Dokdonella sp.]MCB1569589.1 cysteine dioxygenase family protein [Xanthomonadales bacterium]MCB1572349.1 cysteine dioxygenase family protein [Xanthomonadales bacterium]MCB1576241.1 cysteine dioxygenase family protein [Xanthomonadales bacterium]
MLALDFPGSRRLVESLDDAVRKDCTTAITDALRQTLCRLMHDKGVSLPDCVYEPASDHYARREIYRSDDLGYCVIAMTWGPGQGTAIHDHAGMWCVEGVWHGQIEVTPYELVEQDQGLYRFESRGTMLAGPGSAGSLIPPHEYHTIRNPSDDAIAVSLHIYRGSMTSCAVFRKIRDNWYERDQCKLSLDRTH